MARRGLRDVSAIQFGEFAAQLEEAGYGAIWLGMADADLVDAEPVLGATNRLVYATGILNVWTEPAEQVLAAYRRVAPRYPDRLLLGVGVGHPEVVRQYQKPFAALVEYLDALHEVPAEHLALAALGPKMLTLAGQRTAGAHPYLTTPEHTRRARETLGTGPLLLPEQKVVLETDPDKARAIARPTVGFYIRTVNYSSNLRRLGFTDEDLAGEGSDRLVDALVAWGDPATVADRLTAHLDAGADHVSVQVLGGSGPLPIAELREISAALG